MKINVNFQKISSDNAMADYIDRRLCCAFSRLAHAVQSTVITVMDINGPKGGVDKLCRVVVKPVGLKSIVITERQADLKAAVNRSISRASQTLSRKLKRQKFFIKQRFVELHRDLQDDVNGFDQQLEVYHSR